MTTIESVEQLEAIYGIPTEAATVKVSATLIPEYKAFVEMSRFLSLATCGPEGLDCSPRGDKSGVVRVVDDKTIHLPDRKGNNRIDSLRNIVRDPRVALLFLIPGAGNTLRVNGTAQLSVDPLLLESFAVEDKMPRSVIIIKIQEVYFQCARAILRSELWNPALFLDEKTLPTPGTILAKLSGNRVGGECYDREWPERAKKSMW